MPAANVAILTRSVVAAAALSDKQAVNAAGNVATAAGRMRGLAEFDGAILDRVTLTVLGTGIATAGAAIADDAELEIGTGGKLITLAAGKRVAIAMQAAAADGDPIEVLLTP